MMSTTIEDLVRFRFQDLLSQDIFSSTITYKSNDILLSINNDYINCDVKENLFSCKLERNRFSKNPNLLIICTRDYVKVTEHSIEKLISYKIQNLCDILIVDDRSSDDQVLQLSDKYQTSYLRISNIGDIFNYSVLNNIAAYYAKVLKKDRIIFYNNDVWPNNKKTIPNLIIKHQNNNADISGCKLIYPSKKKYMSLANNTHLLSEYIDIIANTIQHGGIYFALLNNKILKPCHLWRFHKPNNRFASNDTMCYAITGAFQIVNTEQFFQINGFTEGLSTAFQDIDLCIKALEKSMRVYYFGSESLYHAESLTIARDKITEKPQMSSDNILWNYLWNKKLSLILGYQQSV